MFESLTVFLPKLREDLYDGVTRPKDDSQHENTFRSAHIVNRCSDSRTADEFVDSMYDFIRAHEEMKITNFGPILKVANISWRYDSMSNADPSVLDARTILALIMCAIRTDRVSDNGFQEFLEAGCITKWLARLKEIDDAAEIITRYRIYISEMGEFRDSSKHEFITEFGCRELVYDYIEFMRNKESYSDKDIIVRKVVVKRAPGVESLYLDRVLFVCSVLGEYIEFDET